MILKLSHFRSDRNIIRARSTGKESRTVCRSPHEIWLTPSFGQLRNKTQNNVTARTSTQIDRFCYWGEIAFPFFAVRRITPQPVNNKSNCHHYMALTRPIYMSSIVTFKNPVHYTTCLQEMSF